MQLLIDLYYAFVKCFLWKTHATKAGAKMLQNDAPTGYVIADYLINITIIE